MRIWKDVALEALRFKDLEARIRPIRNLRHPSLVALPASHVSENEEFLVYDHMARLFGHFHGKCCK